jgi:hypothetical protein
MLPMDSRRLGLKRESLGYLSTGTDSPTLGLGRLALYMLELVMASLIYSRIFLPCST